MDNPRAREHIVESDHTRQYLVINPVCYRVSLPEIAHLAMSSQDKYLGCITVGEKYYLISYAAFTKSKIYEGEKLVEFYVIKQFHYAEVENPGNFLIVDGECEDENKPPTCRFCQKIFSADSAKYAISIDLAPDMRLEKIKEMLQEHLSGQ